MPLLSGSALSFFLWRRWWCINAACRARVNAAQKLIAANFFGRLQFVVVWTRIMQNSSSAAHSWPQIKWRRSRYRKEGGRDGEGGGKRKDQNKIKGLAVNRL